jgi:3-methyladenine DNA glycosylase AlkD
VSEATYAEIHRRLADVANPAQAVFAQRFFKTGKGEYGEGDHFLGIRVPVIRAVGREYPAPPLATVQQLLTSAWHEERLLAVQMLVRLYDKGGPAERETVYRLYLDSLRFINNWDIVDSSASQIVGRHLSGRGHFPLLRMARSPHLWTRRVAVIATAYRIGQGHFDDILLLAARLLNDKEDLIHKAVGWMLREVGKRDRSVLEGFLDTHAARMPRTMLRYAIEKLPAAKRRRYMGKSPA